MQLIVNHNFNPAFPPIDYRTPCNCPGAGLGGATIIDCGCPEQLNSDPVGTYPQLVTLSYLSPSCSSCTLAPSGLVISGNIDVSFSAPFDDPAGHTITIVPQPNLMIDGYGVTATEITLFGPPGAINPASTSPSGFDENFYLFQSINGLTVTDPSGGVTTVTNPGFLSGGSFLSIADVGDNHGTITNAFGLLDDIFSINIDESEALTVTCSNGATVQEFTSVPVTYDMTCPCVQSGTVVMTETNASGEEVPIMTYHYGYDGTVDVITGDPVPCPTACPGNCDDKILVETHCATFHNPNSAITRSTCGFESIDCL